MHITDWIGVRRMKVTISNSLTTFNQNSRFMIVRHSDQPLYLVTTAELTQRGSSKSTRKLLLLLTDRRTALGASGGSEEADGRQDGETGEWSAGHVSN